MKAASACRRSSAGRARCRRQGRERHLLRARLVPDLRRGGRQPEHRRRAEGRQGPRRHDLQGPSRRLQPARPAHRQGAVEARTRSGTSPKSNLGGAAPRRLQVSLHRSAGGLAGAEGPDQHADPGQHQAGSVRADAGHRTCSKALRPTCNDFFAREFWRFVYVQQKVGELGEDGHRVSADAEGASFNLQAVKEQVEAAIAKGHPATERDRQSGRLIGRPLHLSD